MKNRIIVASVLLAVFAFVAYIDVAWINFLIFATFVVIATHESLKLYAINANYITFVALIFFCFTIFMQAIFAIFVMLCIFASILAYTRNRQPWLILPLIYPVAPIFLLYALLKDYGMLYLCWLVVCIAMSDIAAFFVGKILKQKFPHCIRALSPSSPSKSLQGAVAGALFGTIFGSIFAFCFIELVSIKILCASFLAAVFGIFGDLFESYLKRIAGLKDSGNILGEHGGVLDRFDAMLFSVVAMLVVLSW